MRTYNYIKIEKKDFRFILTLARPEKRNAFTPTMVNEIAHAFHDANEDDAIKVVIIKAEGPVFCAGMDLDTFAHPELDKTNPTIENENISLGEVFDRLLKPSVAFVEGDVIAGAFLILLGCTYVYCKRDVRFRLPELALGIFPFQVMASLLKVMPEKKVLQLCLDTGYFSSAKAIAYGIVDGYLDELDTVGFLKKFEEMNVVAVINGFKAMKALPSISPDQKYTFLLRCLEKLKR
ncbi:enoyl-CoA hydratase/isomerase family protein [Sphingobacterium sp. SGG-5]|uniref:enoyl-CoA hydratase/isomerase family protein n=1 Tax=Sphingobacterium sp. SGG-5 TaxID=2710881 RepID=UPI0013ECECEA|nr:enoyl-CoA hydratase/isomerase family protein [Sphingobacterium sp. SGG-5]NGM61113.1 enoyl-CoA hydratase/isomerase family protein [Sphingobacterium sp. SGG-5]